MRSHALPHRLCHQFSGIVAFSQRHFLAYTYGQAGTTRSIYPLLSPGATWPLTPLGSQAIPWRSVPQNTRQPVRLLSLCAGHCISPHPSPLSHGCLLREERWAVRNCQPGTYYAGAGRRVAEADLRHISVSDHPITDTRETCTPSKGHLRSPELFLGISFDWIEIQTRSLYHCVCFVKAHRLICNMTYMNQHMTLTRDDLRSNFEIDLSRSSSICFEPARRAKHIDVKIMFLPSILQYLFTKNYLHIKRYFDLWWPQEPWILTEAQNLYGDVGSPPNELSNAFCDFVLVVQVSEPPESFWKYMTFWGNLTSFDLWCRSEMQFFVKILPYFVFFTCKRHIISWAPFDLREKPLWRYTLLLIDKQKSCAHISTFLFNIDMSKGCNIDYSSIFQWIDVYIQGSTDDFLKGGGASRNFHK